MMLLLQEYKHKNVVLFVILYFADLSSLVIFICIVYFNKYFKPSIWLCVHWFKNVCNISFVLNLPEDGHTSGRNI